MEEKRISVYTLRKSEHEEIHFAVNYYQNRVYLDLRTWLQWAPETGFRPSAKGISIPLEFFESFKEGVLKLLEHSEHLYQAAETGSERQTPESLQTRSRQKRDEEVQNPPGRKIRNFTNRPWAERSE